MIIAPVHQEEHIGQCKNLPLSILVLACTLTLLMHCLPETDKSKQNITSLYTYMFMNLEDGNLHRPPKR